MSSIADLLRLYAQQFEDQHAPQNMTIALREAAREIGSLQTELGIEREYSANIHDENLDNIAEIDRLRAALEQIAANTYGYEPNAMSDEEAKIYFANLFFAAQGKARAALNEGKSK